MINIIKTIYQDMSVVTLQMLLLITLAVSRDEDLNNSNCAEAIPIVINNFQQQQQQQHYRDEVFVCKSDAGLGARPIASICQGGHSTDC